MKKALTLGIALCIGVVNYAQQIQSQRIIKFPRIGSAAQDMLYWNMDNDSLYIYVFNQQQGTFVEKTTAEIETLKEKLTAKEKAANVLSHMLSSGDNAYKVVMLHEVKIPTNLSLDTETRATFTVDHSTNTDPEVQGYFKRNSGIAELNISKEHIGQPTDFSVQDLSTRFPLLPQLNTKVLDRYTTEIEGDGILGLKNLKTYLKHQEATLDYGSSNGFTTEISDFRVFALETLVPDTYTHIKGSFMKGDQGIMQAWFTKNKEDKKDQRIHEGVTFDLKKKIIHRIPFESSFSKKSYGHVPIFNPATNKVIGFFSAFGYDKKAKKDKRGEDFSKFHAFISTLEDEVTTIEFNSGDKKTYKNAIDPVTAYKDEQGLVLFNIKGGTMFKGGDLEAVRLSSTGELTVLNSQPTLDLFEASNLRYLREDYNAIAYAKGFPNGTQMRIAHSSKDVTEYIKGADGSKIPKSVRHYDGVNVSLLQPDYTLQNRHIALPITKNPIALFPLIETDTEIKYMAHSKNKYGILTVTPEEIQYSPIEFNDEQKEFMRGYTSEIYLAFDTNNTVLVDKNSRTAYIQHQYYTEKGLDNLLTEIIITAISF